MATFQPLRTLLRWVPPLDLKRDLEAGARWRETSWGIAAAFVVISYCALPLFQFAEPNALFGLGLALGGLVVSIYAIFIYRGLAGYIFLFSTVLFLVIMSYKLDNVIVTAARSAKANGRRCLAIQKDMLSSMPLRSDDPDLFQALGCKAQGEGSVYAERDLKEDPVAMIEQDARRSELPYRNPYRNDGSGAVVK